MYLRFLENKKRQLELDCVRAQQLGDGGEVSKARSWNDSSGSSSDAEADVGEDRGDSGDEEEEDDSSTAEGEEPCTNKVAELEEALEAMKHLRDKMAMLRSEQDEAEANLVAMRTHLSSLDASLVKPLGSSSEDTASEDEDADNNDDDMLAQAELDVAYLRDRLLEDPGSTEDDSQEEREAQLRFQRQRPWRPEAVPGRRHSEASSADATKSDGDAEDCSDESDIDLGHLQRRLDKLLEQQQSLEADVAGMCEADSPSDDEDEDEEEDEDEGSSNESSDESEVDVERLQQQLDELLEQQRRLHGCMESLQQAKLSLSEEEKDDDDDDEDEPARSSESTDDSDASSDDFESSFAKRRAGAGSGGAGGGGCGSAEVEAIERPAAPCPPEQQQLISRPRNARPLGALQPESDSSRPQPHTRSSVAMPASFQLALLKDIHPSGVDSDAVREWLLGRASGPLCLARVLDGLQRSRWSTEKACKDLSFTEDLYGGRANGYGGTLGGMVGGVARALAADMSALFGGALTGSAGPAQVLADAGRRLRDAAGAGPVERGSNQLDGLSDQQVNLAFRRRCIRTHPSRERGHLQEFLCAHLDHELLRQWQALRSDSPSADRLSDQELMSELAKGEKEVREACASSVVEEELKRWDSRISEHLLRLSGQKELLEAEVSELRNHGNYSVLGVAPEATDAELARAYKAAAFRAHPDRGGSKEAFQALQAAYEQILEMRGSAGKSRGDTEGSRPPSSPSAAVGVRRKAPAAAAATTAATAAATATAAAPGSSERAGEATSSSPAETSTAAAEAAEHGPGQGASQKVGSAGSAEAKEVSAADTEAGKEAAPLKKEEEAEAEKPEVGKEAACPAAEQRPAPPAAAGGGAAVREEEEEKEEKKDEEEEEEEEEQEEGEEREAPSNEGRRPVFAPPPRGGGHAREASAPGQDNSHGGPEPQPDPALGPTPTEDGGGGSGGGFQVSEETIRKIVNAIPAEAIAQQAELAVDGARVCARIAALCGDASQVGSECWPQIRKLASQCLDISEHVFDAASVVGRQAADVPHELIPVLDVVSRAGARLKKAVAGQVLRGAKGLIGITEEVSDLGREVLARSTLLASSIVQMREALGKALSSCAIWVSATACSSAASLVATVARLTGECADTIGAAVLRVADAQRTAQNFIEVLEAAGAWAAGAKAAGGDSAEGKEKKEQSNDEEKCESSDSDEEEKPKTPKEQRVDKHRALLRLNREVVSLQQELRDLVSRSPSLLEAVSVGQKAELFALVAELLASAKAAVGRAWRLASPSPAPPATSASSGAAPAQTFVAAVEAALDFVFAAGSWDQLAIPSLDARLLRLASLIDSQLLKSLLEDLFNHTLALAGGAAAAPALAKRLEEAARAMQAGCVPGR